MFTLKQKVNIFSSPLKLAVTSTRGKEWGKKLATDKVDKLFRISTQLLKRKESKRPETRI